MMWIAKGEFGVQPGHLFVGEVFDAALQGAPDAVERSPFLPRWPSVSC